MLLWKIKSLFAITHFAVLFHLRLVFTWPLDSCNIGTSHSQHTQGCSKIVSIMTQSVWWPKISNANFHPRRHPVSTRLIGSETHAVGSGLQSCRHVTPTLFFFFPAFLQLPDGWSRVQLRERDRGGWTERRGNGHSGMFVIKPLLTATPLINNNLCCDGTLTSATEEGEASDSQKDSRCEGWRRWVCWLHWRRRARFDWFHYNRN